MASNPLHDWVCDGCGRKVYGRRKVPKRCHGLPMRPMGSPWKNAGDDFYAHVKKHPGWATELPDDYWISEAVLKRLQEIVDNDPKIKWDSSVKRRQGYIQTTSYGELR